MEAVITDHGRSCGVPLWGNRAVAGDTFSAPCFSLIEHAAAKEPAFLIRVHDTPLQQKLNYYEERPRPQ